MEIFTEAIKDKNTEINQSDSFAISVIRVTATIFIFLCHLVQENSLYMIKAMGLIFNVGIVIFFFISGYLYGRKHINNFKKWFIQRYLKISIPIAIFIFILSFVTFKFNIIELYIYMLNLQGFISKYVIQGAGHLWFISVLMLCYLITPILQKLKSIYKRYEFIHIYYVIVILFIIQLLISLFCNEIFSIYLVYIYCYSLLYFMPNSNKEIVTKKMFFYSFICGSFAVIFRFISKIIDDKYSNNLINKIYECVIVPYTHAIFGFCIIVIIYYLVQRYSLFKNNKSIIKIIDEYSFEIYIAHYMFMVGPFRLMGISQNFILNTLFTILGTAFTAVTLHWVTGIVGKSIKKLDIKI